MPKFYSVAVGRKPGIYMSWEECKEQTYGFSRAKFQSFKDVASAEAYYAKYNNGALPKKRNYRDPLFQEKKAADQKYNRIDTCLFCGRPFKQLGKKNSALCKSCKKKSSNFNSFVKRITRGSVRRLSRDDLVFIKKKYKCDDVFDFIAKNPSAIYTAIENSNSGLLERELDRKRKNRQTFTGSEVAPPYVKKLLGESKELVRISGDERDPFITFHCKRCEKDFKVEYHSLVKHKGHDCSALVSSGEGIVKDFLTKQGVHFLTQRDTLKCVNPDTGHVMPYDFEMPEKKIVIEVQGEQHRTFIEMFHVDMEGFLYQQKKDAYKKKFAEERGYKVIELWYPDLESGKYRAILLNELNLPAFVEE